MQGSIARSGNDRNRDNPAMADPFFGGSVRQAVSETEA